jgi:hypothetical protein
VADDAELAALRSILTGVAWAVETTIVANGGFDPKPGSQAAAEIADEGPYVARSKTPVLDAHSVALMRLASATEHFTAIARLLEDPPVAAYGPASLARTALENSARAWRAFDPALDLRTRIGRGRTDFVVNLKEVLWALDAIEQIGTPQELAENKEVRDKTSGILTDIIDDSDRIGLTPVRNKKGEVIGIVEAAIGPTAAIAEQLGPMGRLAYNDLSAVAHGTLFGLVGRLEEVGRMATMRGVKLMTPSVNMPNLRNAIAISLLSYREATDRRMTLYGWDMTDWNAWKTGSARVLSPILRGAGPKPRTNP